MTNSGALRCRRDQAHYICDPSTKPQEQHHLDEVFLANGFLQSLWRRHLWSSQGSSSLTNGGQPMWRGADVVNTLHPWPEWEVGEYMCPSRYSYSLYPSVHFEPDSNAGKVETPGIERKVWCTRSPSATAARCTQVNQGEPWRHTW